MTERKKLIIILCVLLVIALLSYFVLGGIFSQPENFKKSLSYINEKQSEIFELTGMTVLASIAVGAIPGDATTPLAEKITDIGSYFLIALCAVFLEKYLLTLTGLAAFKFLIPGACIVFAIGAYLKNHSLRMLAVKLVLLALIITAVVPTSIKVSQAIEKTSEYSIAEIEAKKDELVSDAFPAISEEAEKVESAANANSKFTLSGVIEYMSGLTQKASDAVKNVGTVITENVQKKINDAEDFIHKLLIILATMIVTSCLVPLAVFWLFMWIGKALLGINLDINVASIRNRVEVLEQNKKAGDAAELAGPRE